MRNPILPDISPVSGLCDNLLNIVVVGMPQVYRYFWCEKYRTLVFFHSSLVSALEALMKLLYLPIFYHSRFNTGKRVLRKDAVSKLHWLVLAERTNH